MYELNIPLMLGGILSIVAALLHFACIVWGGDGYRRLGAGEKLAHMADEGHWFPSVITLFIGSILFVWGLYAFSGAGLIAPLPFLPIILVGITLVYLLRAVAFPLLKPVFPENSTTFWLISSGICLVISLLHLTGLIQIWEPMRISPEG